MLFSILTDCLTDPSQFGESSVTKESRIATDVLLPAEDVTATNTYPKIDRLSLLPSTLFQTFFALPTSEERLISSESELLLNFQDFMIATSGAE